ncbi:haemolysin-type calcium binding [Escherichia phage PhaxI]|uniref:Tail spike TSP1/Gp66 N-terminal domain-containing protein n=1 Tax=Escherichia phage PhaxI TaxID=926589 RepID=G9IIM2_9CAUD|nr:haemolysin-type calcium binding [Escherichia phage PhaxI]AEW24391.1 hypothetical protein [Escherichia phage PhaxI]
MANKPTQPLFPLGLETSESSNIKGFNNSGTIEHSPGAVMTFPEDTEVTGLPSSVRYNPDSDEFEGYYENGGWLSLGGGGIRWETLPHAPSSNLLEGRGYLINNTTGTSTVVLPSPTRIGDSVTICDAYGKFATYPLTVSPSGNNLYGSTEDMAITTDNVSATFTWSGHEQGWVITSGVGLGQGRVYSREIFTQILASETSAVTLNTPPTIVDVYADGKRLAESKYSLDGNVITFSPSLPASTELQVIEYTPIQLGNGGGSSSSTITWVYNGGSAIGGETEITLDIVVDDVPAIDINGSRQYKNLGFTFDPLTSKITLAQELDAEDEVVVIINGTPNIYNQIDYTLREVARVTNVKDTEVVYFSVGAVLSGYKVIYDKVTQRSYFIPELPTGTTAVSLSSSAVLVHSAGSVDLGALAVSREEYVTLSGTFDSGAVINTKNELLTHTNGKYRWDGSLPKTVDAGSTPETSGGVGLGAWLSVGVASLKSNLNKPNGLSYIGTVSSVSELSSIAGLIGDSIILDSYVDGFNLGGGVMVAVNSDTVVDNIVTFQGNGVVWKRKLFNGVVDVYEAGYTGTGDLAIFINKINAVGFDCVVPVSGEITTPIIFDIAKGALIGKNKCTLIESASATGGYYLTIVNTDTDYTNRDVINATALMTGVSFVGKGTRKLAIGGSTSGEVSELRISNCGFISTAGIEFLDNAYRILFDKCTLSRSFTNSVIFNSPANSGEVIKFNHCWMVDNGGPFTFVNGQFIFDSCSLPAVKKSRYFDPVVALSDNATMVFTNGNIEYQPGQSFVGFTVDGSSRLSISDSTILLPNDYSTVPIVNNGDGVVILNNCSLPLYGNTTIATGFATRQLIGGLSKKVMSRGCYPRAGFITSNWDLGCIVSPHINSISNGSGQFNNISNWALSQTGSGVVTATVGNDVPNDLMFSTSFVLSVPSVGAAANFTQTIIDCEPGRYFQLGFWAKNTTTTLASIRFLDQQGNAVADSIGYNIPVGNTFNFYALVDCVPPGAYKAEINFNVSSIVGGIAIHNVIYGLI